MPKDKLHQEEAAVRDHLEAIQERLAVLKQRLRARTKLAGFIASHRALTQADVRAVAADMKARKGGRPTGKHAPVGQAIRAARKKAGLTTTQLGKKLGVSGPSVHNWEVGRWQPHDNAVRSKLKALLGIDVSKLAANGHAAATSQLH